MVVVVLTSCETTINALPLGLSLFNKHEPFGRDIDGAGIDIIDEERLKGIADIVNHDAARALQTDERIIRPKTLPITTASG
jgi:hypothetical protein